jgi:hypothetical protein
MSDKSIAMIYHAMPLTVLYILIFNLLHSAHECHANSNKFIGVYFFQKIIIYKVYYFFFYRNLSNSLQKLVKDRLYLYNADIFQQEHHLRYMYIVCCGKIWCLTPLSTIFQLYRIAQFY